MANRAVQKFRGHVGPLREVRPDAGNLRIGIAADDRIVIDADDGDIIRDGETFHRTGDGHDGSRLVIGGEDSAGSRKLSQPGAELADEVNARNATHPPLGLEHGIVDLCRREAISKGLFAQTTPRAGRDQEGYETDMHGISAEQFRDGDADAGRMVHFHDRGVAVRPEGFAVEEHDRNLAERLARQDRLGAGLGDATSRLPEVEQTVDPHLPVLRGDVLDVPFAGPGELADSIHDHGKAASSVLFAESQHNVHSGDYTKY